MDDTVHTGLVVYSECFKPWDYRVYVVDLDTLMDTGMPLVRRIDDCAFHVSPQDPRNNEEGWLKREERKHNRPLNFGDVINWSLNVDMVESGMETVIVKFKRVSNKNLVYFPTRCHNGVSQVLLEGVINPNDPAHLYTQYFPSIPIPVEKQGCASPNVYFKVWVTLKLSCNTGRLLIQFDSFHDVCPHDIQMDVGSTPWNKINDKYCVVRKYESDSEDEEYGGFGYMQKSLRAVGPQLEIYGHEAVRTGDRSVLLWKLPGYKAVLPFRDTKVQMNPGECYIVDAVWNEYENMYMINHISISRSATAVPATESGLLRVSVKENETIRGLFENEMLGPIDDPRGILGFLHLSPLAKNAIPLVVSDGSPSRGGQFRFQVEDIHGDKKRKLANWVETAEVKIENELGVVIGDGAVFSAAHSPIFFKYSAVDDPPPIGTFVNFSAIFNKDLFRITEWRRDVSKQPLKWVSRHMDPKNPDKKQPVFFVSGKVPTHKKIKEMILTSEFGLVDDNLKLLQFDQKNTGKQYSVWVCFSQYSLEDPFSSRTAFQVVGARAEGPEERVKVRQVLSEEELRIQESFAKILEESKKTFEKEQGEDADDNCSVLERFTSPPASSVSTPSVAPSPCPTPDTVSVASTPTPHPKGLFSSLARSVRSDSSCSVRPESSASRQGLASPNGVVILDNSLDSDDTGIVGESDEARKWMQKREQRKNEPYTGPVSLPNGSKMKFDIIETLKRIRFSYNHGKCGLFCDPDCPWLRTVAQLVVSADGFWDECTKHFPNIASDLMKSLIESQKGGMC